MQLIPRAVRPVLVAATLLLAGVSAGTAPDTEEGPFSVRITSPLGRTGLGGPIRIVAQVRQVPGMALQPVRFYVDNVLLGEDHQGPPFAVEWLDDNPFEPREIRAEAQDDLGHMVSDSVMLKPLEIAEATETLSVMLDVSVQDENGRFVSGLEASDFVLHEDDAPQVLDLVEPERLPATYTLLVDSSQSMARRFDFVRRAASRFTQHLRPQDQILVAPFSRTLGTITGPTHDQSTLSDAIMAIRPQGGTAILESLANVATRLDGLEGRQVVVLITDGYDEHSTVAFDESIAAMRQTHATVYVVAIGGVAGISLQGEQLLRQLATATGGRAFFPAREDQLSSAQELVAADVQHRYLVGYTPTNQNQDGTWRRVSVATGDSRRRVRARPGYFAPAPPPLRPTLEFTITDTERNYVEVSKDNLIVIEDGVEQTLDAFHEAVTPVSIVLALDGSGSMRKSAEAVREAARTFVQALRPEDSLAVMSFADEVRFAHDLTTNRTASLEAIDRYQTAGGTALYDALAESLDHLKRVDGRRVVVVLTDGRDENNPGTAPGSVRTFDEVLARLTDTSATAFAIGLGPKIDGAVLERLAVESGGEAYFPDDVSTLPEQYRRIVENLRRRYVISYSSTRPVRDGAWRTVEIRSRLPGTVIRSRGGYFAVQRKPEPPSVNGRVP